jgi:hypothetical protein
MALQENEQRQTMFKELLAHPLPRGLDIDVPDNPQYFWSSE